MTSDLKRCRPLNDPVKAWSLTIGWLLLFNILAITAVSLDLLVQKKGLEKNLEVGVLIVVSSIAWLFWMMIFRPILQLSKKRKILFLRAFSRDQKSKENQIRNTLRAALPIQYALGGIRAPRHRMPWFVRLFSETFSALRYVGSNRFELEAADRNWFARLLASAAQAHAIIVDLRSLTPYVHDEIEFAASLATQPGRLFLLIDDSRPDLAWAADFKKAAKLSTLASNQAIWLKIPSDFSSAPSTFTNTAAQQFQSIPDDPIEITSAAYEKARGTVEEGDWATPWLETSTALILLFWGASFVIGLAFNLLLSKAGQMWFLYAFFLLLSSLYLSAMFRVIRLSWAQRKIHGRSSPRLLSTLISTAIALFLPASALVLSFSILVMQLTIDDAKNSRVISDMKVIDSSLQTYHLNAGQYPTTEQGLSALVERPRVSPLPKRWFQLSNQIPQDPWKNDYIYQGIAPDSYRIFSMGADGIKDTSDDIFSK